MMNIEVWMEGYVCTGESSRARMIGKYNANSFSEAVKMALEDNVSLKQYYRYESNNGNNIHTIWGCELFDNEKDARKEFG